MQAYLARSVADVANFFTHTSVNQRKWISIDTEGTSLDTSRSDLVGWSFCYIENHALYVPNAHKVGTNVPTGPVIEILDKLDKDGWTFGAYNQKHDRAQIKNRTGWIYRKMVDVLELVFLEFSDRRNKDLKTVAREDLGIEAPSFESLFTAEEIKAKIFDLSTKTPERCAIYAAHDADSNLKLWVKKAHILDEYKFACDVDHRLIDVLIDVESGANVLIDIDYVKRELELLGHRAGFLEKQVWRIAGCEFDINSPKQLGVILFERLGLPGGKKSEKSGMYGTNADVLDKLAESYPIVEYIMSYRKLSKAAGTYLGKLKTFYELQQPVKFRFNMFGTPTFRFAAPGGAPDKDGGLGINIQAVSNGEMRDMLAVDFLKHDEHVKALPADVPALAAEDLLVGEIDSINGSDAGVLFGADSESTESSLFTSVSLADILNLSNHELVVNHPWLIERLDDSDQTVRTCIRDTCVGCDLACVDRGVDITRRRLKNIQMVPSIRNAFKAPDGYSLLSFDYDRQEIVVAANISGEPKWLTALAPRHEGESELEAEIRRDLHRLAGADAYNMTSVQMGQLPKAEYKAKRQVGKVLNLASLYGAGPKTIAEKCSLPMSKATEACNNYRAGLPVLFDWMERVARFAQKEGYTTTWFKRKRWLKHIYGDHSDRGMVAYGDRSAVNSCVQGTSAEITRIAMIKVADALKKNNLGWKTLVGLPDPTVDLIKMILQVHDELMFIVRDDLIRTVVPIIRSAMEFIIKGWQVQLTVSPKVGKWWGRQKEAPELLLAA